MNRENFIKIINSANTILILTHKGPDGDAVSSSLAIYKLLTSLGKKSTDIEVVIPYLNENLSFIDNENIIKRHSSMGRHDLVIVVDCSDYERVEGAELLNRFGPDQCINIDHHEKSGKVIKSLYSFIDPSASSCTCVIFREFYQYLSEENKLPFCRYVSIGIMSDTIGLKLNVTEECNQILDICKNCGINIDEIGQELKKNGKRTQELSNIALKRLFFKSKIACTYILQADLFENEKHNIQKAIDHKSIIEKVLNHYKCDTIILIIEEDNNQIKGSMRTNLPTVDLSKICASMVASKYFLQGGGHSYSAGFHKSVDNIEETLMGIYEKIINEILAQKN